MVVNIRNNQNPYKAKSKEVLNKVNIVIRKRLIIYSILILAFLFFFRKASMLILFAVSDLISSHVENRYKIDTLFSWMVLGVIIFSYSGYLKLAAILSCFVIINRIILARIKLRHLIKIVTLFIMGAFAYIFNFLPLPIIGTTIHFIRIMSEYIIQFFIAGEIKLNRVPKRILHLFTTYFFLSTVGEFIIKFFIL